MSKFGIFKMIIETNIIDNKYAIFMPTKYHQIHKSQKDNLQFFISQFFIWVFLLLYRGIGK